MVERFEILSAKVLAGEASGAEEAELRALLEENPELQEEWSDLEETHVQFRKTAGLVGAIETSPTDIPSKYRRDLQEALKTKFPNRAEERDSDRRPAVFSYWWRNPFALVGGVAVALLITAFSVWFLRLRMATPNERSAQIVAYFVLQQGGGTLQTGPRSQALSAVASLVSGDKLILASGARGTAIASRGTALLQGPLEMRSAQLLDGVTWTAVAPDRRASISSALFTPVTNLQSAGLLVATRSASPIPVYSPLGATASVTPLFLWKAEAGKTYDLTITDEFDPKTPRWEVAAVLPPLQFTNVAAWAARPLARSNLYRLRIAATGEPLSASTSTFRTADADRQSSASDAAKLLRAIELLTNRSGFLGDALADLLTLPSPWAESELASRLRLLAFAEAGYREEFQRVLSSLPQK